VSRFDGTNFVNFTTADGLTASDVITVTSTPDGQLWFGTRTAGLLRYDPTTFAQFDVADGLIAPNSPVGFQTGNGGAALAGSDGTLWFACGHYSEAAKGVVRFDGRGFESMLRSGAGVTSLAMARDQSIWMGLRGEGIARYTQGRFEKLTQRDG
jgi:ligand-binding sensor domain-containing protein